ncbi:Txe/YoeB family addiction module toxin [Streptomyces sp. XM4193]|uniref:Txe/YoeB family addiction module toxin n=1 Tax=Streptomyces sp. XM4193 TaxID=2929782 RepID=UPI001FFA40CE|nr:Txe/YoeB family addiction module toxin [Streptomyces sp. XM4193]MCK1794987.1 Txe/YoeB family addiction module toxin [Streptomyces sp. XM4193]
MKVLFLDDGWNDYLWWQANDRKLLKRINQLIADIDRNAHEGIGKPEPLRSDLSGYWSRRIDSEHRLVYRIDEDDTIHVVACRFHYERR